MTEDILPSSFGLFLAAAAAGAVLLGHRESLRRTKTALGESVWVGPGLSALFGARAAYIVGVPELRLRPAEWLHFASGGLLGWVGLLAGFVVLTLPFRKHPHEVATRLDALAPALAWLVAMIHLGGTFEGLPLPLCLGGAFLALCAMSAVQLLGARQRWLGQTGLVTFAALPLSSLLLDGAWLWSTSTLTERDVLALSARVLQAALCLALGVVWSKTPSHRAILVSPDQRENSRS